MNDEYIGSDERQRVQNPFSDYVIYEGSTTVNAVSNGTYYSGESTVDISFLNLEGSLPDVDGWYYQPKALGGGTNEAAWYRLPFVKLADNGEIEEYVGMAAAGTIAPDDTINPNSFRIRFIYFNRNNSGDSREIRYKVNSKRVGALPST